MAAKRTMASIEMVDTRVPEQAEDDGIEALYRAFAPDAVRLAFLLTGDSMLAEDLSQDAFVRVLGRFRNLRNRDAFWWYLRKAVVNLSRSYFRRRKVERAYLERQRRQAAGPASADPSDRHVLVQALLGLRAGQRAAVVLRYFEDLTESQTADVLGWPVGTVKSTVSRALDRLQKELATDD
jgi:RNA polymerase sigma-70 factor (sigma-E family)